MSALVGSVLGVSVVSLVYYICYKMFKDESIEESRVYKLSNSVKKGISILFQQLFILNNINIVSLIVIYLSALTTLPLTVEFMTSFLVILLTLNNIYIWLMVLFLIVSGYDFIRKLSNFKKKGGKIQW